MALAQNISFLAGRNFYCIKISGWSLLSNLQSMHQDEFDSVKALPHEDRSRKHFGSMNVITHSLRKRRWQVFAVVFCVLFGSIFILNVHPIGDGLWFWYAILLRNGQRLYADMHLPLQPLFVLLTAWTQELLGK